MSNSWKVFLIIVVLTLSCVRALLSPAMYAACTQLLNPDVRLCRTKAHHPSNPLVASVNHLSLILESPVQVPLIVTISK